MTRRAGIVPARSGTRARAQMFPERQVPRGDRRLHPSALLALQLYARGHSVEQIARLVEQTPGGAATLLGLAALGLGAGDVSAAIAVARRRGLIV